MSKVSCLLLPVSVAFSMLSVEGHVADQPPTLYQEIEVVGPHESEQQGDLDVASISSMNLAQYVSAVAPDRRYGRISQDLPYSTLSEWMLTFPMRRPRTFNAVVATTKTWLADLVVQMTEIRSGAKAGVDWKRSLAFALFGFFYIGLVQWFLYVSFLSYVAPTAIIFSNEPLRVKLQDGPGQADLLKQVMVDNFFFAAFAYFPVFYMLKEFVNSGCSRVSSVVDGLHKYRNNFVSDNTMSMIFWIPGDLIAFAAPMYMRLPAEHAVSFIWTMLLSYRRGSAGPASKSSDAAAKKADCAKV